MVAQLFGVNREKPTMVPQTEAIHNHCLDGDITARIPTGKTSQHLHLTEGRAWVTYGKMDIIVDAGESIEIPSHTQAIVISSANIGQHICYQVTKAS